MRAWLAKFRRLNNIIYGIVEVMKNEIKEYGIVLLVDDNTTKQAHSLNQKIAQKFPNLENVANIWHVTLYHGAFAKQDLELIFQKLQQLYLEPLEIKFSGISQSKKGYIHWEVEKNLDLQELHTVVVNLASKYHQRPLQMSLDLYDDLSFEHQQQIDEFGSSGLFELFAPHLTLFYQPLTKSVLTDILPQDHSLAAQSLAERIVIGELGYGNILKILYSLPLPK